MYRVRPNHFYSAMLLFTYLNGVSEVFVQQPVTLNTQPRHHGEDYNYPGHSSKDGLSFVDPGQSSEAGLREEVGDFLIDCFLLNECEKYFAQ